MTSPLTARRSSSAAVITRSIVGAARGEQADDLGSRPAARRPSRAPGSLRPAGRASFQQDCASASARTSRPAPRHRRAPNLRSRRWRTRGATFLSSQRIGVGRPCRVDRQSRDQDLVHLGRLARASASSSRPRRLGVYVVHRHRRHAAPIVDAGADQVVLVARRRDWAAPGRASSAGRISRAAAMVHSRSSRSGSSRVRPLRGGLGAEILHDHFLDVAVARCRSRDRISASSRSARVSPMPIKMPVVNGTGSSPARRNVSNRAAGCLSGEP